MGDNSRIEWTHATWNPILGCDRVSSGCAHCYAVREVHRLAANPTLGTTYQGLVERQPNGQLDWTGTIRCLPERLDLPLRWKRPRRIFVASMADPFHEDVPDEFLDRMFEVMWQASWHAFQLLTKRPARMLEYFGRWQPTGTDRYFSLPGKRILWPLRNVWLGVSVENQQAADERIPLLLQTPAAVRFLSCEPLLGPLDLTRVAYVRGYGEAWTNALTGKRTSVTPGGTTIRETGQVHWVIAGGESGGPPNRALIDVCACRLHDCGDGDPDGPFRLIDGDGRERPWRGGLPNGKGWPGCDDCHGSGFRPKPDALTWLRSLRDQCVAAGVPFFFKQFGGPRPKSAGRLLDGRTWDEMPAEGARP